MRSILVFAVTGIFLMAMFGCSGSSKVVVPEDNLPASAQSADSHQLWGIWQFIADPEAQTLEVVPLRSMEMHLNALPFLEPPALVNLTLESLEFNGNIITADIGLRHPFLGLTEFTGFDVSGIFITNGSISGFTDSDIVMPGDGDTRLLNPDGYSRWWNPSEYPNDGTIFGYNDGLLGTPDSVADYNCTVNGYKYYCDNLEAMDDIDILGPSEVGIFSAGQKNVRRYEIEIGTEGLIFNYAIDANWQFPSGGPPWTAPDDFPQNAWRAEAWNISISEIENTLWNDGIENGGDLSLLIDVWAHYNAGLNTVFIDSPGSFPQVWSNTPIGGGEGYSTYQIDIVDATPAQDSIDLLISVKAPVIMANSFAYFTRNIEVADEPVGPPVCGTGIYGTNINTPFTDMGSVVNWTMDWLVSGPYAGEMLICAGPGIINRYNTDNIGPLTGNHFLTMPPITNGPYNSVIYHIEVEPVTGRVVAVPSGLGINNAFLVYDDEGNLLSADTGTSIGANRKIVAMDANNNGDIWMLTTNFLWYWMGDDLRLEKWTYQSVAPYYVQDTSSFLNVDEQLSVYESGIGAYRFKNDVPNIAISWYDQRLFALKLPWSPANTGILKAFDLNPTGPPTYQPAASLDSVLQNMPAIAKNDEMKSVFGGVWCDHSDPGIDTCRILLYSEVTTGSNYQAEILRIDGEANILNQTTWYLGMWSWYMMGVNYDSDSTKNNIIAPGFAASSCYMAAPPGDW